MKSTQSLSDPTYFSSFHHFAVTYDGVDQVAFYVDGRLDVVKTQQRQGMNTSPSPLRIGASGVNTNRLGVQMSGFYLSPGARTDFGYGQFADVSVDPTVSLGSEYGYVSPSPTTTPTPTTISSVTTPATR